MEDNAVLFTTDSIDPEMLKRGKILDVFAAIDFGAPGTIILNFNIDITHMYL